MANKQPEQSKSIGRLQFALIASYALSVLFLTVIIILAVSHLYSSHVALEKTLSEHRHKTNVITQTQLAALQRTDDVQLLLIESDPFELDDVYLQFLGSGYQVGKGRNATRELLVTAEEIAVMQKQDKIITAASEAHDVIADMAKNGEQDQARQFFIQSVKQLHTDGNETFQRLRDLQSKYEHGARIQAQENYNQTLYWIIVFVTLSVLLSMMAGYLLYRYSRRTANAIKASMGIWQHDAWRDELTGLFNRKGFTGALEDLQNQSSPLTSCTVLYLDLDKFKDVNDQFGHDVGDKVLAKASERIKHCLRKEDIVARVGGDEFVAVLPHVTQRYISIKLATKIISAFEQPIKHHGQLFMLGISIGIATVPIHSDSIVNAISTADRAMYQAKRQGRGRYSFPVPDLSIAENEQNEQKQEVS